MLEKIVKILGVITFFGILWFIFPYFVKAEGLTENFDSFTNGYDITGQSEWTQNYGVLEVSDSYGQSASNSLTVGGSNLYANVDYDPNVEITSFQISLYDVSSDYGQWAWYFKDSGGIIGYFKLLNTGLTWNGISNFNIGNIDYGSWSTLFLEFSETEVRSKLDDGAWSSWYAHNNGIPEYITIDHNNDPNDTFWDDLLVNGGASTAPDPDALTTVIYDPENAGEYTESEANAETWSAYIEIEKSDLDDLEIDEGLVTFEYGVYRDEDTNVLIEVGYDYPSSSSSSYWIDLYNYYPGFTIDPEFIYPPGNYVIAIRSRIDGYSWTAWDSQTFTVSSEGIISDACEGVESGIFTTCFWSNLFRKIFVPSTLNTSNLENLKDTIETKVPFAYFFMLQDTFDEIVLDSPDLSFDLGFTMSNDTEIDMPLDLTPDNDFGIAWTTYAYPIFIMIIWMSWLLGLWEFYKHFVVTL